MKILFICKHNRFRSKVAEVIFKKLDAGKNEAKSAGIQLDFMRPYVCENVKSSLRKRGYKLEGETARQINDFDIKWADKIVIVADNVSPEIFKGKDVEVWEIVDADESEEEKIDKIVAGIERRVKRLVKKLDFI